MPNSRTSLFLVFLMKSVEIVRIRQFYLCFSLLQEAWLCEKAKVNKLALQEYFIHFQLYFACKLWRGKSKESRKSNVALTNLDNLKEKTNLNTSGIFSNQDPCEATRNRNNCISMPIPLFFIQSGCLRALHLFNSAKASFWPVLFSFFPWQGGNCLLPGFTQEASARAAAILLGLTLALWQLNPASCALSPDRTQRHIHLAKGEGNPCIPSLFCLYFGGASCSFCAGQGNLNLIISSHVFFSIC